MATKFQIKRTSVSGRTPNTADPANTSYIASGELAVNLTDQKLYSSNGTVAFEVGANLTSLVVNSSLTIGNSTVNTTANSTSITLKQIYANGAFGTSGQVLTSNGTGMYWAAPGSGDVFTILSETFTGNGSNTQFTLAQSTTTLETFVFLNGVAQVPTADYSISGTTLTFVAPPSNGDDIEVRTINIPTISGITFTLDSYTGNGSNTNYTLSTALSSNTTTFVYLNGVAQIPTTDYGVSGTTLTFTTAPPNLQLIRALTINPTGDYASDSFTANSTVNNNFTLSIPTTTFRSLVFINGVAQAPSVDYTISGLTLSLASNAAISDVVQVRSFYEEPSASGANTTIQYNGSSRLKGSLGFTFNETTNNVTVGNTLVSPNLRISASNPPAGPTATGTTGTITWDSSYLYVAVGTDTWKKTPITTDGASVPGGSNTHIQYNDSNTLNGSAAFTFNEATNTVTLSNTLAVGSNLTINTSTIFIGNSTVNTTIIAGNVDLQGTQLRVGNVVINGNQFSFGNVTITDTQITIGNSTVNTVVNSSSVSTGNLVISGDTQITANDNIFYFGKQGNVATSTDSGMFIKNPANTNKAAVFSEVDGQILSYGINVRQLNDPATDPRNTNVSGGIFRFDTRLGASFGDASCFVIKRQPNTANYGNTSAEFTALSVRLDTGDTYIAPQFTANVGGVNTVLVPNVMIGTTTALAKLTINASSYIVGSVTIANTTANGIVLTDGTLSIGNSTVNSVLTQTSLNVGGTVNATGNVATAGYFIPRTLGGLYGNVYITAANNAAGNSWIRIQTQSGYVDIGSFNTGYVHFYTDRSRFYFDKEIQVNGLIKSYQANNYLGDAGIVISNGNITVGNSTVNASITTAGVATFGNTTVSGDLVVSGNVFFNGTTTNVNSTNLVVEDKNIIIGDVATPTDVTADGGGITLKGATDKTLNWVDATDAWTSSEDFNLVSGKSYEINGTVVVNSTSLGTGITGSSLTSVGTLTTLTVSGATNLQNTLAAGNTTVTGFVNASVSVNSALITVGTSFIANTAVTRTPQTLIVSGGGATGEGGQIVLGYGNNLASAPTGQANNTWNIDVVGGNTGSTPILRVFTQNGDGSTTTGFAIANTGRMHVGSVAEQTDSTFKVTGSANVTTSLTVGTTLAAGNTTVTGFANVKTGSNAIEVYPSGTWAGQVYNATDSSTSHGLVVGNRWAGASSTVFEVGSLYGGGTGSWRQYLRITGLGEAIFSNDGTERMRIAANGNVGIGNSTPTDKLRVEGSASIQTTLAAGNTTITGFANVISNSLQFNGTSTSTTMTNHDVAFALTNLSATDNNFVNIVWRDANLAATADITGQFINQSLNYGTLNFHARGADGYVKRLAIGENINFANSSANTLFIAANGNVGIANTTPIYKLDVTGQVRATTSFLVGTAAGTQAGDDNLIRPTSTNSFLNIKGGSGRAKISLGNDGVVIASGTTDQISFHTNAAETTIGTERMQIAANGNVGIANTTPASALSIKGNQLFISNTDTSTNIYVRNEGNNTTARFPNLTIDHYRANTTGGDTGGQAVVELRAFRGNTSVMAAIQSGDVLGGFNTWGSNSTSTLSATRIQGIAEAAFTSTATAGLQFFTTNAGTQTEKVRIAANGNVGIGNTAPTAPLCVNGNTILGNTTTTSTLTVYNTGVDANVAAGVTLDVNGPVIRVGDRFIARTYTNGVGIKIHDQGAVHYSVGQIGSNFVIADTSTDGDSLYPATRTNIISANSSTITVGVPMSFGSYTTMGSTGQTTVSLTTSATTANQVVATAVGLGSTIWRSVEYLVQVTSGSAYQLTKIGIVHDGTTVYKTEYATVLSGALLATFDADINSGTIRLLTTPVNAVTVYKGLATFVAV